MARVLAISNIKGGVGKTTTTANLAAALVERGRSVLAIDLDPQASLTFALGFRQDKSPQTICQVLNGLGSPIASIIQPTQERIDLAPASHDLAQVEQYLESTHASVTLLRAALETLRDRYDYVLVDCPANAGILTGMALAAADQVLIPLIPDSLSLQALNWLLFIVNQVHDNWNPGLRVAGLLLTMYDPRTRHAREIIETVHHTYGSEIPFFKAVIRDSVHLSEAASAGKSILAFAPDSQPTLEYRALAEEIETGVRETSANELYFVLVRAYETLRQRRFLEAFAAFSRATEINPKLSRAWVGRAECALAWDESVRSLARALELEPQMQDVRTSLEQRLNERISSAAPPEIPEMMALSHFLETIALNVYAEQIFRRVTEIDAHHEEAWLGLARTTPNSKDAVAFVQRCLEFNPNSPKAQAALIAANKRLQAEAQGFVDQGTALLKAGKRVEAWDAFAKAIHLNPQNDCAWVGCARSTNELRSRSNFANHALRINPENEEARLLCAAAQDSQSQPTPPRWPQLVRFLVPAGIAAAALAVVFISTVAR